jgi:Domain of unknown function (DUF6946)
MAQIFFGPDRSPLEKPEDVIPFLGRGKEHWREGRSAYEVAHSWFSARDLPFCIRQVLLGESAWRGAVLTKAIFENKTKLDNHGRGSQTDVLAFVRTGTGNAVVGIEAKVDESFGPLVREWNDYGTGKLRRLVGLLDRLEFESALIGDLRYQLFHRVTATLIEAQNCKADRAAMIVQSFDDRLAGFDDFVAFADALGTPVSMPGVLSRPKVLGGVTMRLGWTQNPLRSAKN